MTVIKDKNHYMNTDEALLAHETARSQAEQKVILWQRIVTACVAIGAACLVVYLLFALIAETGVSLPFLYMINRDFVDVAQGVFIVIALLLVAALVLKNKAETKVLLLDAAWEQSALGSTQPAANLDNDDQTERKRIISNLSSTRIASYVGALIVGYYFYSVIDIRIDGGAYSWGAVGALSVYFLAPYLLIGIIVWVSAKKQEAKLKRQLNNLTRDGNDAPPSIPVTVPTPIQQVPAVTQPIPEITQPEKPTTKPFVLALAGIIAGLIAALIALFAIFIMISLQRTTEDAAAFSIIGFALVAFFTAPAYITCLILVSLFSVRSITKKQRKDVVVMGWIGVCLAYVPGIIMMCTALWYYIQ